LTLLGACLLAAATNAPAQQPATPPTEAASQTPPATLPPSHADAVTSALQALARQRGLDTDTHKQVEDLLHQAQDDESRADQLTQQWQSLNQSASAADSEAQRLEDALSRDDSALLNSWRAALPEHATAEQLEALAARERDAAADARASVSAIESELARQTTRPAQLRDELAAAHSALDANSATPGPNASGQLAQAQHLRAQAAQRLATIQIALLNLENRSYEPRMRLLSVQLRERQRAVIAVGQHVSTLEALLLDRTGADVSALQARVARERANLDSRSRTLIENADANVELAARVADTVREIGTVRTQKLDWDAALRDTTQALKNTEERVRIGGVSEAVGLILLAEKRKLKPLPVLRHDLDDLQTDYAQSRMSLIDVREQQSALNDLGAATTAALSRLPDLPPETVSKLRDGLAHLLGTRAQILVQLGALQSRLAATQGEAEGALQGLIETTGKLNALLDSRLLWTPSHAPVDRDWLVGFGDASANLFAPARWQRALSGAWHTISAAPLRSVFALGAVVLLLLLRRRAPAQLATIAEPMRRIRSDRYRLTGLALLWTLLAAAPLPAAIWLIGTAFEHVAPPGNTFANEIGLTLTQVSASALVLSLLRALTLENGLGQAHFRWPRPRRDALRVAAPWLALIVLPTQWLIALVMLRGDAAAVDALGRALLVVALLALTALVWWLLAPGRLWTARYVALQEPSRLRQTVRVLVCATSLAYAVLVLRGYFVTVLTLSGRALYTLVALLAASVLYGFGARWLVLGERHLALKRMEEKLASQSENAQADTESAEALHEPEPEEITLSSVSAQTRRLLRLLIAIGLVAMLLWIWSDVTPALTLLGDVPVWSSSDVADGKAVAISVSLRDVLEALVVFALTWAATRNLPGLLEVGILRRFDIDAPTRYAITSVTRYIIVFAGVLVGMSMLGLHWSNLQWLAAGFSVGLGFGLQEIFANFVSGLMVLFERPFRIGDIITIGNVEGTVARIRTRATTIVDWDNKEVIVPNKSFITERVINWTLSDSTTRIVIPVGIAYRNDPQLAQKLLLEIANAHPLVLDEPAPTCWMTGFGASSQNFDLRVYVAEIGQRNRVRTELQFRIADVFREHDIEIAFPQMDLWIRNGGVASAQLAPSADATSASKRS
jgi:potassium efflux system protein